MNTFNLTVVWQQISDSEMLVQNRNDLTEIFLYVGENPPVFDSSSPLVGNAFTDNAFKIWDTVEPRQFMAPSVGSWYAAVKKGTAKIVVAEA